MNVYKPLIIDNVMRSLATMSDSCVNFRKHLAEGAKPNRKKIAEDVERPLMLVTACRRSSATTIGPSRAG